MEKFDLEKINVGDIPSHPTTKAQFMNLLCSLHKQTPEFAEATYEREVRYFGNTFKAFGSKLPVCSKLSVYSAFLEIAITNLSTQPGAKSEAFFFPRVFEINGKEYFTCNLTITAYGELAMRIKAGQVVRLANPIIVYEGDMFTPCTNERGELIVKYQPAIPRKSNNIIACYVCIYLPSNGIDFKFMLPEDIMRLKNASGKQNKTKGANALYSSNNGQIDPGFLAAKCIKHAFKTMPKLRAGEFVVTETELEYEQEQQEQTFEQAAPGQSQNLTQQTEVSITEDEGGLF